MILPAIYGLAAVFFCCCHPGKPSLSRIHRTDGENRLTSKLPYIFNHQPVTLGLRQLSFLCKRLLSSCRRSDRLWHVCAHAGFWGFVWLIPTNTSRVSSHVTVILDSEMWFTFKVRVKCVRDFFHLNALFISSQWAWSHSQNAKMCWFGLRNRLNPSN